LEGKRGNEGRRTEREKKRATQTCLFLAVKSIKSTPQLLIVLLETRKCNKVYERHETKTSGRELENESVRWKVVVFEESLDFIL
jgi:hypothetical protein